MKISIKFFIDISWKRATIYPFQSRKNLCNDPTGPDPTLTLFVLAGLETGFTHF